MAFWLYSKNGSRFERKQPIKLTGKEGLLARFLTRNRDVETPFAWELRPADIIQLIDGDLNVENHAILIDMLPEALAQVSLYRLTSVQGASEYDESDLVLACKMLYQGKCNSTASDFKECFLCETSESDRQMVEALRLTGGVATGTYLWAKPKMDIGAAICPPSTTPKVAV